VVMSEEVILHLLEVIQIAPVMLLELLFETLVSMWLDCHQTWEEGLLEHLKKLVLNTQKSEVMQMVLLKGLILGLPLELLLLEVKKLVVVLKMLEIKSQDYRKRVVMTMEAKDSVEVEIQKQQATSAVEGLKM